MNRLHQFVLIVSSLLVSWLSMMAVHEFGHVLGAWVTGGQVSQVVLHPLAISRTDVSLNPQPLAVVWAGPLVGCIIPFVGYLLGSVFKFSANYLLKLFCGICLIANGTYIGMGSFGEIGDAGVMLQHGSEPWHLWMFGLVTTVAGLSMCHGLGPEFGLGESQGKVSKAATYATSCLLVIVVLLELCLFKSS